MADELQIESASKINIIEFCEPPIYILHHRSDIKASADLWNETPSSKRIGDSSTTVVIEALGRNLACSAENADEFAARDNRSEATTLRSDASLRAPLSRKEKKARSPPKAVLKKRPLVSFPLLFSF